MEQPAAVHVPHKDCGKRDQGNSNYQCHEEFPAHRQSPMSTDLTTRARRPSSQGVHTPAHMATLLRFFDESRENGSTPLRQRRWKHNERNSDYQRNHKL